MQLYFIRHGQSANNALWDRSGSRAERSFDPELTDLGRQQATCVARYLALGPPDIAPHGRDRQNVGGFGITHVYTSLMVRAIGTGYAITEALELPLHSMVDLHEEGGLYLDDEVLGKPVGQPGRNRADFETECPRLVLPDTIGDSGWWNRAYEYPAERPQRAKRVVTTLLEKHGNTEDRVALVSHGGFYNWFLAALLGLPAPDKYWFSLNNAAISRFELNSDHLALVYLNRMEFLPPNIIT